MPDDIPVPNPDRPAETAAAPPLRAIAPRPHLFCFGLGYSALALARQLAGSGWMVRGTCRSPQRAAALAAGYPVRQFDRDRPLAATALDNVSHILVSVAPDDAGDPVLDRHGGDIATLPGLAWLGYLSSTGVYGDRGGGWVDETSALRPTSARSRLRAAAESGWLKLWRRRSVPVHIFRLAAIYGPGRSPFAALRAGTARRIDKPGQVFSRIHVDDLAGVLAASIARPRPGAIYNVCDDEPAPPEAVIAHAARLLGMPAPPLLPFAEAPLSEVARRFYADNKRVRNRLIKCELGVKLRHPDYRSGLAAVLAAEP
ncbi:MAG TPA: SDR family oxidoreductase [Stellaceae bacterium]|nr:SDR family oxidoreductase [Stellaceae bacterium]